MRRPGICLFAWGILFVTGCTNMTPPLVRKPAGHTTEETALYKNSGKDEESESDPFSSSSKKEKKKGRDSEYSNGDEDNPFAKARSGSSRVKESDGLTKLLDSFSDPRKAEIYRDLGID